MKSPSNPCPIASCRSMPGQPGPKTTVCSPAGISFASSLKFACLKALSTARFPVISYKKFLVNMSPKTIRTSFDFPFFSTDTVTFILTSGLES